MPEKLLAELVKDISLRWDRLTNPEKYSSLGMVAAANVFIHSFQGDPNSNHLAQVKAGLQQSTAEARLYGATETDIAAAIQRGSLEGTRLIARSQQVNYG